MTSRARTLFVTATGTDVGKTYVSALILKTLHEAGLDVGYYKAAASGYEQGENGLPVSDATFVAAAAGLEEPHDELVSFAYRTAVSPHLAARIEGDPVDLGTVRHDFDRACGRHDYLLVEGSGGIVCPLRIDDDTTIMLEDVVTTLDLETVIVADAGLGTLNALATTACYLEHRSITCKGVILNRFIPGDIMHEDNRVMAERLTGLPIITCIPNGAQALACSTSEIEAMFS